MADNRQTIFQRINNTLFGTSIPSDMVKTPVTAGTTVSDRVLYTTTDRNDYEKKLLQYKQQKLLSYQWKRAQADTAIENAVGYSAVQLMFRDADLMDATPEIGSALDIISEEACPLTSDGKMLKITSKSKRVKSILEDLFYNRLSILVTLPMVARATIKYGNQYMLLNIDKSNGILGWKQLPVYEMTRVENGYSAIYTGADISQVNDLRPDETKFVWVGHNEQFAYQDWQVAHFRLLKDSIFLPYGVSCLHKARRAWRMWSMMEDAMLIYRQEKSVERRVFKVYVGAIDDADVPAFMQKFADNFKRTPIVDPETGQIDLRKNFLSVDQDYFIPVRDPSAPTPIENLPSAQNPTEMDDIQYMQNKILSALRVPKTFLNFQETQGKGQNLSLMDIRFARMVNNIQQYLLMELNKVAMVHLHLLNMDDELLNFSLSLNNPSAQIEALELEDITKRIQTATAALTDPGIGMPLMSLHMVLKKIMKMTDAEIKDMLNEIRLEKAMAAELEQTSAIIKKTGMFDSVDRIYGDYNALNGGAVENKGEDESGGSDLGGGGGIGDLEGGSLNMDSLGSAGSEDMSDMGGTEESTDMENASDVDNGTPMESRSDNKPLLNEKKKTFIEQYFDLLNESEKSDPDYVEDTTDDFEVKNAFINETVNNIFNEIDNLLSNTVETNYNLLNEHEHDDKNGFDGVIYDEDAEE